MIKTNLSHKEIIDRIDYFRTKKNISAYKLGMLLGHSKTYFYRIESGEIQLTLNNFLEILEILNISTSEFFSPIIEEQDKLLFEKIKNLSPDNKRTISELLKNLK